VIGWAGDVPVEARRDAVSDRTHYGVPLLMSLGTIGPGLVRLTIDRDDLDLGD